jgi:hypothetical protein
MFLRKYFYNRIKVNIYHYPKEQISNTTVNITIYDWIVFIKNCYKDHVWDESDNILFIILKFRSQTTYENHIYILSLRK